MVLHLEPNRCEIRDLPMKKKNLHPRTEESISSNEDNTELARKKKSKKNNSETQVDSSSFVALVKASNLQNDTLNLPKGVISPKGLKRICRKIVLTEEGKRSWTLDLRFNNLSNTFYISRGWRNFCDENGKKAKDFFIFKLVGNGATPLLSFSRAMSGGGKSSKKASLLIEPSGGKNISKEKRKKNHLRYRDSTSSNINRFITRTVTHDCLRNGRLHLPLSFMRENGLDKPGMITLVGKDGTKWLTNLNREATGRMSLGKGWKEFAKANGFKIGDSFKLELILENGTATLSLVNKDSTSDPRQRGKCSKDSEKESISTYPSNGKKTIKDEDNREKKSSRTLVQKKCHSNIKDSLSPMQNRSVTMTLVPEDVRACTLHLPSQFMRAHGIDKLGKITLLGKDGMDYSAYRLSRDGFVALGIGWKGFCETNGVQTGESFTLEFIHEQDATPVLKFHSNCGD